MTQSGNEKLSFAVFIKVAKSLNKQLVLAALLSSQGHELEHGPEEVTENHSSLLR